MSKRPLSPSRRKWLWDELAAWREAGVISPEQWQAILSQYESAEDTAAKTGSRAVNALMGAAATLVAAGVFLLMGFNWDAMPDALKLVVIFLVIVGTYAAAFAVRFKRQAIGFSNVLFFLGAIFYGCGIFLVAQIFNLNAHYPDGLWWWAVGVLPLAVCLESELVHALLVALLAIWCGTEMLGFSDFGLSFWWRWRWFPNGAYTLVLLSLPGFWQVYRKNSHRLLWIYVPLITWWACLQSFVWEATWHWHHNPLFFIGAIGGLLLIAAEAHAAGSRMAIPYRSYGTLLVGALLIPLSFKAFYDDFAWRHREGASWWATFQTLAILAVGLLGLVARVWIEGRGRSRDDLLDAVKQTARRQWVPVGFTGFMALLSLWDALIREPYLPTIFANVAMLTLAIWLMHVGLREDRGRPFSAGVAYFLMWTVMRYADLFGNFGGMVGGAMLFFLCGAFLFGMALFWKRHKVKPIAPASVSSDDDERL